MDKENCYWCRRRPWTQQNGFGLWWCYCNNKDCDFRPEVGCRGSEDEAIKDWNSLQLRYKAKYVHRRTPTEQGAK